MGNELVSIQGGPLATLPDHLKGVKGHEGLENVSKRDLVLPRLTICQSGTPQRKKGNPLFIEGLEEGNFFNNVTNEVYGDKFQFISLIKTSSRIYFEDLEKGGGILCRSANGLDGGTISPTCGACPNSRWGGDGKPPACTEFMNFPSVLAGTKQLLVASWKATALKPARTWLTKMDMLVEKWNKPLFAWVSEVMLQYTKNDSGEFFVPTFTVKRWADAEEFTFAQQQYNDLKGKTIEVVGEEHPETDQDVPF